jgi:hypothetical protein
MESMLMLYRLTGDVAWANRFIAWADALLAERDAPHPVDGKPFAWTDRSSNLSQPYVWTGFTGHVFAPLMEFARLVAENPRIQDKAYEGRTYRDHALRFMTEFNRALAVDLAELHDDGGHAFFCFKRHVPVANPKINGSPLPVNMNAALFTAMLHLARAEKALGQVDHSASLERQVSHFVNYLNDRVLVRSQAGGKTHLLWNYATYIPRMEDVGHANLVAKFLYDAQAGGYAVRTSDLVALANTVEALIEPDGTIKKNLLDGSNVPGPAKSVYYLILMAQYSPSLRAKLRPIVERSRIFAYYGPWRQALHAADAVH